MKYGISEFKKPKRSLGQNFFVNANLAKSFVEKVLETNPEKVIEIGPGKGFFTKILLEKNAGVVAIEKDTSLSDSLRFLFPQLEVYNEDIFSKNVEHLFRNQEDTVCFGSLPYNISKKIINYLALNSDIKNFYFIIQKEVAEKYVAKKKNSRLSVSTKIHFDTKIITDIAPENFKPRPNVVSCFVRFERNNNAQKVENLNDFLRYLDKAFKQPRKTLKNNLQKHYKGNSNLLTNRAEVLDLENHLNLWRDLVV